MPKNCCNLCLRRLRWTTELDWLPLHSRTLDLILRYRLDNIFMQIGELARAAGVNIQTIRFYEREGLLPAPARSTSGYRSYQPRDLDRVMFIRRNHEIGFTLAEIQQLLHLHAALEAMPPPMRRKPDEVKQIIELGRERLGQVNEKIRTLRAMKMQLEFLVDHLEKSAPTTCPVAVKNAAGEPGRRK